MISYQDYIGIPFKDNGRDASGYDCWGLVKELYFKFHNQELPDFTYTKAIEDTVPLFFATEISTNHKWKKIEPREGAIVVFAVGGVIAHAGFMINDHEFIHTLATSQTVIEDTKRLRWAGRFKGCYLWQP